MKLIDPADRKIADLHKSATKQAQGAVRDALQCGALLIKKREKIEHGGWAEYLMSVGISDDTARRYMICAAKYQHAKTGFVDCGSLMALYRALGILPELEGGGARNGKEGGKGEQLYFGFDLYSGFMRVLDNVKGNPFLEVDQDELATTREQTAKALQLMDEALQPVIEAKSPTKRKGPK